MDLAAARTRPLNPMAQTVLAAPASPSQAAGPPRAAKIPCLTSLRFFAASMIVVAHSRGLFGFGNDYHGMYGVLIQGVSFFFVLSGTFMTDVPSLAFALIAPGPKHARSFKGLAWGQAGLRAEGIDAG